MIQKEKYIGLGMDQDTAPDKRKSDCYYDALNVKIVNNGRTLSITNMTAGTAISTGFYLGYSALNIVGAITFEDTIYVFTTDNSSAIPNDTSNDFLYKLTYDGTQTELARGHWHLCYANRITGLVNYENDLIKKLYWLDGYNMLRCIILDTVYGTISENVINLVPDIALTTPSASFTPGSGFLTAGNIQYCYNMYNVNGIQSALSPLSTMLNLSKTYEGYNSGTVVGSVYVNIWQDPSYDFLRVYSIHWTAYEQTPKISVVYDGAGNKDGVFAFIDDGIPISTLSLSELLSISPIPYVAKTLATKRERLFLGNLKNSDFNPDIDCRAYSYYNNSTQTELKDGDNTDTYTTAVLHGGSFQEDHDCINPDYNFYKYQNDLTTLGGTGLNFEYTFEFDYAQGIQDIYTYLGIPPKSFKKFEIYRAGIILINSKGQRSPVHWMADFRVPDYGPSVIVGIRVTVNYDAVARLQNAGVEYFQVAVVERKPEDRTIISQGFIVPAMDVKKGSSHHPDLGGCYIPYYTVKHLLSFDASVTAYGANIRSDYTNGVDWDSSGTAPTYVPSRVNDVQFFVSTDTVFDLNTPKPTKFRILGLAWVNTAIDTDIYTGGGYIEFRYHANETYLYSYSDAQTSRTMWSAGGFPVPLHIMDRSTISTGDANINVFSVFSNKIFTNVNFHPRADSGINIIPCSSSLFLNSGSQGILGTIPVRNSMSLWAVISDYNGYKGVNGVSVFAPCMALNMSSNWHRISGDYDKFDVDGIYGSGGILDMTAGQGSYIGIPIIELLQDCPQQYGGNTYEDKQRNEYTSVSELMSTNWLGQSTAFIGDTWVGHLMLQRADGLDRKVDKDMCIYEYVNIPYIEHNVNIYARSDSMLKYTQRWFWNQDMRYFRLADNNKLNTAYNQVSDIFAYYPKDATYQEVKNYPLSVLGSNVKSPGELLDSWLQFNPLNIKQLEGQYGSITKLHNLKGDMLVIQKSGIALLEIEPRIQTADADGMPVQMGIGSLFYNHKYLSTNSGSSKLFTIVDNGEDLFYFNDTINVICSLQEGKLSTLKSIKTLLDQYPDGITQAVYVNKVDQIWFGFSTGTSMVLIYDLLLKRFVTRKYLGTGSLLASTARSVYELWKSGPDNGVIDLLGGGNALPSEIQYLFNPNPNYEKVFHNLEYRLRGTDFSGVQVDGPELNLTSGLVTPTIENKFDTHRMFLPRIQNSRERWRGIYIFVKLSNNGTFSLDDLVLMYNIKG